MARSRGGGGERTGRPDGRGVGSGVRACTAAPWGKRLVQPSDDLDLGRSRSRTHLKGRLAQPSHLEQPLRSVGAREGADEDAADGEHAEEDGGHRLVRPGPQVDPIEAHRRLGGEGEARAAEQLDVREREGRQLGARVLHELGAQLDGAVDGLPSTAGVGGVGRAHAQTRTRRARGSRRARQQQGGPTRLGHRRVYPLLARGWAHLLAEDLGGESGEVAGAGADVEERQPHRQLERLERRRVDARRAQVLHPVAEGRVDVQHLVGRVVGRVDEVAWARARRAE